MTHGYTHTYHQQLLFKLGIVQCLLLTNCTLAAVTLGLILHDGHFTLEAQTIGLILHGGRISGLFILGLSKVASQNT